MASDPWPALVERLAREIYDLVPPRNALVIYDELDERSQAEWRSVAEQLWDLCNHGI
jgi:hypothetical protein